ncbi:MAG: dihydrofolate reductase family protein [Methylococcales bacterium]|nr:dihydrofolate reductase family protein [Methylococcales bacterium]
MNPHKRLLRLFPIPQKEVPLTGLYLDHQIHELGTQSHPFVYANFVSSLDGRIALADSQHGDTYIPKQLMTPSDFMLFMELHAQADCLITHGGYLRALATKQLGNILQVGNHPKCTDLINWRKNNKLTAQPAIVIASASLDFPMHESLKNKHQSVYIATGLHADPYRANKWKKKGYTLLFCGEEKLVQGASLIHQLSKLGYKSIYLIAGPQMLDTIIRENQLSRLYQTITHQLIGGKNFRTLLPNSELGSKGNLTLKSLYYDAASPVASGQFFIQFEPSSY